jgi:hypothetical protein
VKGTPILILVIFLRGVGIFLGEQPLEFGQSVAGVSKVPYFFLLLFALVHGDAPAKRNSTRGKLPIHRRKFALERGIDYFEEVVKLRLKLPTMMTILRIHDRSVRCREDRQCPRQ